LMTNHYHLVVVTENPSLSSGMRYLNQVFAQRSHGRHGGSGTLFEGRFKARPVTTIEYLKTLLGYVARNPVREGLADHAEAFTWSSCAAVLGSAPARCVDVPRVLSLLADDPARARLAYRALVERESDPIPPEAVLNPDEFDRVRPLGPTPRSDPGVRPSAARRRA
jgi:putative transposase